MYTPLSRFCRVASFAALASLLPMAAAAQDRVATPVRALGERYFVELGGIFWNPTPSGVIASERLDIVGDQVDFVNDLGFAASRFRDLRLVLRPAPKHRIRFQYTPIEYTADNIFQRTITFNGQVFPVAVPVTSELGWTVLRAGYEYDFFYKSRGFAGVLFEVRHTQLRAHLSSPLGQSEVVQAEAPLPAIGFVGRYYVIPEIAVDVEVSGLSLRDVLPEYSASYFDWDIHATANLTRNVGVQAGWRRMTTFLEIDRETGDVIFQGLWFGGVVRY